MTATATAIAPAQTLDSRSSRVGGWLLSLSLVGFVVVVVVNIVAFTSAGGSGIGLFADITRAQMDALGGVWALQVILVRLAILVGDVGLLLVARAPRRGGPPSRR